MTSFSPAFGQNDLADFDQHIEFLLAGRSDPDLSDLERFLRANPGRTVRDWKGKGPSVPLDAEHGDKAWHRLRTADVRREATSAFARELPQNIRQAAARDPGLIWNALAHKYRHRLPSDPTPHEKVKHSGSAGPASINDVSSMSFFCKEKDYD